MRDAILHALKQVQNGYSLCGVVDRRARVYPLGSDTKVISILFEIVTRQALVSYAKSRSLILVEPEKQKYYPDFTLMRNKDDTSKVAIDVKTTYRNKDQSRFSFTMGSYTSYIHEVTEAKNNVQVFMQEKWRIAGDRAGSGNTANIGSISGTMSDFETGNGVFGSETEFLEYWRGYKRTKDERRTAYSNIQEFRKIKKGK